MSKPNFIGIGAMKAGTTWLYQCLSEHPEIHLPDKELNFFGDQDTWSMGFDWYEKQLKSDKKVTGEFSVFYLVHPYVAPRIHNRYPETKLIVCLRNPINRSFSHYLHDVRYGVFDKSLTFSEAIEQFPYLIKHSCYSVFIKEYLKYFSPQQILFLIYEDSLQNPLQYVQSVYKFLKVDDQFVPPSLRKKIHPSYNPRFNLLEKFIYRRALKIKTTKNYWLDKKIGKTVIKILYLFAGVQWCARIYIRLNKRKDLSTFVTNEQEKLKTYFQPEIKELEKLINRPLTQWL